MAKAASTSGPTVPPQSTTGGVVTTRRSATGGAVRRSRGISGSTQNLVYGQADVKVYPINEDQLHYLGVTKGLSGLCFTLAAAALGFAINIYKDLQIQGQIPLDVVGYWTGIRNASLVAAIVLGIAGAVFYGLGFHRLRTIKKNTRFNG